LPVSQLSGTRSGAREARNQRTIPALVQAGCVVLLGVTLLLVAACAPQHGTVGAKFGRDSDGHLYVREVPEGLGASRAGLRVGDEVILIEGRDVRPLSEEELHQSLAGERGTTVRLTVLRGDGVKRLVVERTLPPQLGRVQKPVE